MTVGHYWMLMIAGCGLWPLFFGLLMTGGHKMAGSARRELIDIPEMTL
jgi:hypothetical protein